MRLIDADRLKEALHEDCMTAMGNIDESTLNLLMIEIEEIPTAYDVDEVVEQLKKASYETHEWSDGTSSFNLRMIEEADAIEIVKGAVKDE